MDRIWSGEIEAVEKAGNFMDLSILGLPFWGPENGRDRQGEFLSPKTVTWMHPGDSLPTTYFHGRKPDATEDEKPVYFGKAIMDKWDELGGWFRASIDLTKKHGERIGEAAIKKTLRASTGLAGKLRRILPTGELRLWVPGEMTLVDKGLAMTWKGMGRRMAANDFAVAIPALKALYETAGIEWPEVLQRKVERPSKIKIVYTGMPTKEIRKILLRPKKE